MACHHLAKAAGEINLNDSCLLSAYYGATLNVNDWQWAIMTWKCCPHYWPFVRGIHLSEVDCPHKLPVIFSVLSVWTSCWTNSWVTDDFRHHDAHGTSLYCAQACKEDFPVTLTHSFVSDIHMEKQGCIYTMDKWSHLPTVSSQWCINLFKNPLLVL